MSEDATDRLIYGVVMGALIGLIVAVLVNTFWPFSVAIPAMVVLEWAPLAWRAHRRRRAWWLASQSNRVVDSLNQTGERK